MNEPRPRLVAEALHDDETRLAALMQEAPRIELAPQAGLASVLERIDRRERLRALWLRPLRRLSGEGAQRPLLLTLGFQAVVIVMLTGVLWWKLPGEPPAAYRTLSTPGASVPLNAQAQLVVAETLTVGELRTLLEPWRAQVVAGPDPYGAYRVSVGGNVDDALRAWRAHPAVRFAERSSGP